MHRQGVLAVGPLTFATLASGMLGCPSDVPQPKSAWIARDESFQPIRILVDDNADFSTSDDACASRRDSGGAFVAATKAALAKAGFTLVDSEGAPHDAVAKVAVAWSHCDSAWTGGTVTVALTPGAAETQGWPFECFGSVYRLVCRRETEVVEEAVRRLIATPQVVALRERAASKRLEPTVAHVRESASAAPPGWLGVATRNGNGGATVVKIAAESPAKSAGLQPGDEIVAIDSVKVSSTGDLQDAIGALHAGDPIVIKARRNGEKRELRVTLASAPRFQNMEGPSGAAAAPIAAAPPAASVAATPAAPVAQPAPSTPAAFLAAAPQPAAYALIVGIDRYRDVPAAPGARNDAETFAKLASRTLGLRDDHVRVALDDHATKSDVLSGLSWLKEKATAGSRIYFFYSGHGAPTPDSTTYLLPYDGNPKDIAGTALPMGDVMKQLGETKAKEVLAIVDACFSGAGGRSVLPPGARPLMRVTESAPSAKMALFTASQGDEISGPAPGENAGVFTKWVTTALGTGQADGDGDGQVSLKELADWVGPRVARDAKRDNREQHPKLVVGSNVGGAEGFIVEYGIVGK